jgi:hypothetical protein
LEVACSSGFVFDIGRVSSGENLVEIWLLICLSRFLMLPATFDHEPQLRVSELAIGIFAIAILTAGFCLTLLLTFAVPNPIFQGDAIYLPALTSCALGLLTMFYDFAISKRYVWNTPALLSIVAAAVSSIVYAGQLIWIYRKISSVKHRGPPILSQQPEELSREPSGPRYQDPAYYDNYIRNMFPASAHPQPAATTYNPNSISEEEMQRQQMLMLLLHRDAGPSPDASQSTFRIDWQGQDQDEPVPSRGFYAPNSASTTSAYPLTAVSANWPAPQQLRPWDGVWRSPAPVSSLGHDRGRVQNDQYALRDRSQERREERRREIEMGR